MRSFIEQVAAFTADGRIQWDLLSSRCLAYFPRELDPVFGPSTGLSIQQVDHAAYNTEESIGYVFQIFDAKTRLPNRIIKSSECPEYGDILARLYKDAQESCLQPVAGSMG